MDYSAINADDSPHASPWASSPQHNRTSFGSQVGGRDPPSPTAPLSRPSLEGRSEATSFAEHDQAEPRLSQADTVVENSSEQHDVLSAADGQADLQPQSQPAGLQAQISQQQQQQQQQQQPPPQQPGQRTQQRSAQRYHAQRPKSRQDQPIYKLQPRVTGLERPSRKDLILRFDVHTNLPSYRTTQFRDVRRSYVEFTRLAEHLVSANPEALVPALPPPSTPAGVGTDEDETRVKASMQRWLSVVCGNDAVMRDEEIVRFIEGDPGYSPVIRKSQPATGVRRKYIKQFAPPPDDTPELQEARPVVKRFYLGSMDAGQKVDRLVKTRRALGLAESEHGAKLAQLAEQEVHPGLKHGYRKLGRTVQAVGDLHAAQGTAEATVFGEPLLYHSADAFIVKETLTNRNILIRDLLQAQQATRSKLSATDRLKASSSVRRDKVDEAIAALDEARSHETYLHNKTQRVTQNLVHERRAWFARTAGELRASIRELVLREIETERRVLATLESVRPEVRAIDASGGLSRLGREATPAARRANLQSSQGPRGDAWSGVQRRSDGLNRSISGGFGGAPAAGAPRSADGQGDAGDAAPDAPRKKPSADLDASAASLQEDDQDRVDAKNAASRLASSTF